MDEELKISFACKAKVLIDNDLDKYLVSHASLERLKSLAPKDVDLAYNKDLLLCRADLTLVNRANANGHLIDSKGAVQISKHFKYKFIDIEHERKQIVGVISGAGFYDIEGKELTEEEALEKKDPYYLSIGFFVYKAVAPGLVNALKDSNDLSNDDIISLSWELKFRDYEVMYGNKNYAEATLVTDPEEIENLKSGLKIFGGRNLLSDGKTPLYLIAKGDIIPEGAALTYSPAAEVAGIFVEKDKDEDDEDEEDESQATLLANKEQEPILPDENKQNNLPELEINSSQNDNTHVTPTMEKKTKIETIEEITNDNLINIEASAITDFITKSLSQESEKYAAQVKEKEEAIEAAKTKATEIEATVTELKEKLSNLESIQAAKEAEEIFNARMSTLDEEYELDDDSRSVIAKQIKSLDTEAYDVWAADFSKINKSAKKKKEDPKAKAPEVKEKEEKEVKASVEEVDAAELLAKGTKVETPVLNNQTVEKSKKEVWAEAFSAENFEYGKNARNFKNRENKTSQF